MNVAMRTPAPEGTAVTGAALSSVFDAPLRLLTVDDYHKMIEAGILDADEHTELLEGVIVAMSPQHPRHARIIRRLTRWLARALPEGLEVSPQLPLTLGEKSEPEPDLAVVRTAEADAADSHPARALLVVEVAESSLRKDRGFKAALYARFEIPEYWIVNVTDKTVEVHSDRDARAQQYRTILTVRVGETLRAASVPEIAISVADLFA
jgi:Uma2 family endonuclease